MAKEDRISKRELDHTADEGVSSGSEQKRERVWREGKEVSGVVEEEVHPAALGVARLAQRIANREKVFKRTVPQLERQSLGIREGIAAQDESIQAHSSPSRDLAGDEYRRNFTLPYSRDTDGMSALYQNQQRWVQQKPRYQAHLPRATTSAGIDEYGNRDVYMVNQWTGEEHGREGIGGEGRSYEAEELDERYDADPTVHGQEEQNGSVSNGRNVKDQPARAFVHSGYAIQRKHRQNESSSNRQHSFSRVQGDDRRLAEAERNMLYEGSTGDLGSGRREVSAVEIRPQHKNQQPHPEQEGETSRSAVHETDDWLDRLAVDVNELSQEVHEEDDWLGIHSDRTDRRSWMAEITSPDPIPSISSTSSKNTILESSTKIESSTEGSVHSSGVTEREDEDDQFEEDDEDVEEGEDDDEEVEKGEDDDQEAKEGEDDEEGDGAESEAGPISPEGLDQLKTVTRVLSDVILGVNHNPDKTQPGFAPYDSLPLPEVSGSLPLVTHINGSWIKYKCLRPDFREHDSRYTNFCRRLRERVLRNAKCLVGAAGFLDEVIGERLSELVRQRGIQLRSSTTERNYDKARPNE